MDKQSRLADRFQGLLVGTAVGDALGLPREGLAARRAARLFGPPNRHAFVFGRGMISDDTEHSVFVAQSLLRHPDSARRFERRLARSLRWWQLSLPAGVGFATLRAILRSCAGFPPGKAGVYSAGNGPAMRAAPIGAFYCGAPERLHQYVKASSRLTHTDPRAEIGARAIALLAAFGLLLEPPEPPSADDFLRLLTAANLGNAEWDGIVGTIRRAVAERVSVAEFAAATQTREPGPAVRYCWPAVLIRNPIFLSVVLFHGFRRLLPPY